MIFERLNKLIIGERREDKQEKNFTFLVDLSPSAAVAPLSMAVPFDSPTPSTFSCKNRKFLQVYRKCFKLITRTN